MIIKTLHPSSGMRLDGVELVLTKDDLFDVLNYLTSVSFNATETTRQFETTCGRIVKLTKEKYYDRGVE